MYTCVLLTLVHVSFDSRDLFIFNIDGIKKFPNPAIVKGITIKK